MKSPCRKEKKIGGLGSGGIFTAKANSPNYLHNIKTFCAGNFRTDGLNIMVGYLSRKKSKTNIMIGPENYLKKIVESSLDGIAVIDEQGRFEFGNDSFFEIIGWLKEEIIGQYFLKIVPEDERESVIEHFKRVKSGHAELHEITIRTRYGETKYLHVSSSLIEIGGEKKIAGIVNDISEKKRLEINLRESSEKYKDLFDNAIVPMYVLDTEGNILKMNKAGIQILDFTEKEIIGKNIFQLLAQESLKIGRMNQKKKLSGEPVSPTPILEIINKHGEHRWVEVETSEIRNYGGRKVVHGIARDVTEKKRLEQELKESEAKYRDLFENAQDAMYILDIEGNFLKMNNIGLQTLGFTREEVIGSNISKFITPESLEIAQQRQKNRLRGEIVNQTDVLEVVCRNGEHRWVEIKTRDIQNSGGMIEIHGIARDITNNILLKQELKKSNKQRKLLCYLIEGSRGGKTRAKIMKHLIDKSYNANQLAKALNLDYKTVRHHLNVLVKNGIITKNNDENNDIYYISKNIESDLNQIDLNSKE